MYSRRVQYIFTILLLLLSAGFCAVSAQNVAGDEREQLIGQLSGTLPAADTVSLPAVPDSTVLAARDSVARADSLALLEKSSVKMPAFTSAGDSIVEVFSEGRRLIYYYGGVTVDYQDIKLSADYMEYDMNTGIVFARGTLDTLTGTWTGLPEMTQGGSTYTMEEVRYNFNTQKAYITNMVTTDSDGEIRGSEIKMLPDRSISMKNGKYTVCDLDEPHYYLNMTSAKVMTEPNQKTVFGPSYLVVGGVPIPFIGLPFGFIPPKPERATGLLTPTFGQEASRGFYMRDAGIYLVLGQYFDLSVTGDVYSLGSWAVDVNSRYRVNYKFNGSFGFTYSHDQTGEKGSPDFFETTNFQMKWSHSQDAKARPGTSFSASVNFSSPGNNKYNSRSVTEALQNQTSSSISWSKNWDGKFNLSLNALHSQNSRDSSYSFTFPNLTFSMSTIYPFKQKNRVGEEKFYERISIGYNTSLQNRVGFKASELRDGDAVQTLLGKMQNGMGHNFSIGLPNFTLLNYINVTPGVNYGMNWFFRKSDYHYDEEQNKVVADTTSTFGITQTYSGSVGISTRLYGMFNFGRNSSVQAVRHVISPTLSFSVSPELGTRANGWRSFDYVDRETGETKTYTYNTYAGQMLSAPGKGRGAMASFSIANNLEAKVRDAADTTGRGTRKVKLIDQLNFSGSYNFLADSMRLSTISSSLSTTIFEKLTLNMNATLDPYGIDGKGQRINKLNIVQRGVLHPFRVTSANLSFSYNFSGKGTMKGNDGTEGQASGSGSTLGYRTTYYHPVTGEYIPGGWMYYMNPNSPWNLNASFSFGYRRTYTYANDNLTPNDVFTGTVNLNGSLKLTPRMNITANSGFDFVAMKITTSSINFTYDLHCFNIAVSVIPTGQWRSYSFRIAANASALADILRYKKSSSFWDN